MRIESIPYRDPIHYLAYFPQANLVFLDSAKKHHSLGRFSYLAVDPFNHLVLQPELASLHRLSFYLQRYQTETVANIPPFQGGLAGYFSYEWLHFLEKLPPRQKQRLHMPLGQLGCYDIILSFDHVLQQAWIVSSGFPETEWEKRQQRAEHRLRWVKEKLARTPLTRETPFTFDTPLTCWLAKNDYLHAVQKVKNYILDGDIFQANIARCYHTSFSKKENAYALYQRLRTLNPAPFAAFLQFPHCTLLSSSPERFIHVNGNRVETRPIKGTSARHSDPRLDAQLAIRLQQDPKERAENTMIVDLMRNDLSKVCVASSIEVPEYCAIETYQTVHHLVSAITGQLKPSCTALQVLQATFPGGSITGAPKIRAMEIIDEIEPIQRGPYCGAIGYLAFNGNMDTSITIRTLILDDTHLYFHTGSAIVLDSDPQKEWLETEAKACALKQLIEQVTDDFVH